QQLAQAAALVRGLYAENAGLRERLGLPPPEAPAPAPEALLLEAAGAGGVDAEGSGSWDGPESGAEEPDAESLGMPAAEEHAPMEADDESVVDSPTMPDRVEAPSEEAKKDRIARTDEVGAAMVRPSVKSKEVDQVVGLVPRERWSRLDVAPFLAIYAIWAAVLVERISRAGLESFYLYQLATYALGALHALAYLGSIWSVELRSRLQFRPASSIESATHVKVTPHAFSGSKDIVPLSRKALSDRRVTEFSFRKLRFALGEEGVFRELQYPVKHSFAWYRAQSGLPDAEVERARAVFGANAFEIPIPSFRALLKEQLLAPFFCFQVFCVGLWALDEYWYYSLFTLLMLVSFECTVVAQRLRNLKDVRRLQAARRPVMALRGGRWVRVPGEELVPGDLVSICRVGPKEGDKGGKGGKGEASASPLASSNLVLQADMLLLAGTAIVDESVLTGESTPAWKSPVGDSGEDVADASENPDEARLVVRRDKAHVLFGATTLLQAVPDPAARLTTPDGGCLALVLRTGFGTAQGRLMRTILYSTETVSANNAETFFFILFLLVWAVAASAYVLYHGLQDPDRDRFKLVLNCIMILTSVIPPELPMELTIAVNASLLALSRKRVFCTEPFRIPLAGHVTTCCFDKTGTLTSDQFLLEGVAGVEGLPGVPRLEEEEAGRKEGKKTEGKKQESGDGGESSQGLARNAPDPSLLSNPRAFPPATARVLACCQSLAKVDGELVGDPLEKVAVERLGWTLKGDSLSPPSGGADATLEILHRFHFSSALQRMSVVVRGREGNRARLFALTKGSPEALRPLLAAPPPDYAACYARHASQGARVLALAWRALETEPTPSEVRRLARSEVEQGLRFAGFVVFRSPLKPESEPTLRALRESAHELLVITGDAALTACHAARAVHVLSRPQCLILEVEDEGASEGGLEGGDDRDASGDGNRKASGDGNRDAFPGSDQKDAATPKATWVSPDRSVSLPFSCSPDAAAAARSLSKEHDLCLTGAGLRFLQTQQARQALPAYVCAARVFARVAPEHKELVVRLLRASGRSVLMCGDGTNDVGALKAAHVGVAILAPPEKKARASGAGTGASGAGTGASGAGT
ncbi:hypothetical protein H632_c733p0, partial [Helicosporidium sp. ATCC 50920]